MVCSDTTASQSVVTMKTDEDKLVPVDDHKIFAISGEAGDRVNFSEYIIANARLYALRNATRLSTKAIANYTRGELAAALRKVRVAGGRGRLCSTPSAPLLGLGCRVPRPPPHHCCCCCSPPTRQTC